MDNQHLNSWIEISGSAYALNLRFFRKRLLPGTELSVVIKANGYGHGLPEVARLAVQHGADSFCVHSLEEALQIRNLGISRDVLIMGHVPLVNLPSVVEHNFRLAVFNIESLDALARLTRETGQTARLHLKLETGTHRQGIDEEDLPRFLEIIREEPGLRLEAVYTHFANIEDTTDHSYALSQLNTFKRMAAGIRGSDFPELKMHSACSAAILLFPETQFEMVRLGISQYGLWPSRETFVSYKMNHSQNSEQVLKPVLRWKTRVGQIKTVPSNRFIGYGCSYQTTRESRIAILPIGYSDGYDRRLSNQSYVLIRGKRAPVRGRICMNITMVDITDIPGVELQDEVVLLGDQGDQNISAEFLAGLAGTINYELVTRINPAIPRIVSD